MNRNKNWNCDNDRCDDPQGEVRRLPHSSDPHHGASILCHECYLHEMRYRREQNPALAPGSAELPAWESLEVYTGS